jgi:hypothetical protein
MPDGKESTAISIKELSEKGMAIYRSLVEDGRINEEEMRGKVVAIEVESKDFFIGSSVPDAYDAAKIKYPDNIFHFVHIGSADKHSRISQKSRDEYAWPV